MPTNNSSDQPNFSVSSGVAQVAGVVGLGTPTVTAGSGAGTSPTVSISGTNISGEITVTTGTTPVANSVLATITFGGSLAYPTRCVPIIEADNAAAAALYTTSKPFCPAGGTTSWTIMTGTAVTGLTASTAFIWHYLVTGF